MQVFLGLVAVVVVWSIKMKALPPPSPRTSYGARFALTFFALIASLPALVSLGASGLIPNVVVTNFEWSASWVMFSTLLTLAASGLWYLAISGRNPFYQLEVAGAKRRAEAEVASVTESKPRMFQRIVLTLLSVAALYFIQWALTAGVSRGVNALFR